MGTARSERDTAGAASGQEVLDAPASRSLPIARRGVRSLRDVAAAGAAMFEDTLLGAINPKVACAGIGSLSLTLRAVQLQLRHSEGVSRAEDGSVAICQGEEKNPDDDAEIAALEAVLAEKKAARGKAVNGTPGTARKS